MSSGREGEESLDRKLEAAADSGITPTFRAAEALKLAAI